MNLNLTEPVASQFNGDIQVQHRAADIRWSLLRTGSGFVFNFVRKSLAVAAAAIMSTAALAYSKSEECYTYIKAQDYPRAVQTGRQAVRLEPHNGEAHFCLGLGFVRSGDLDNALRSFEQSERLFSRRADLLSVYAQLGSIAKSKGDLQQALNYYSRQLALSRELGDRRNEVSALNNVSLVFSDRGDLDKAIDYLQQAIKLERDENEKGTLYNNLALMLYDKGDLPGALEYFDRSINVRKRTGDFHGYAVTTLNKGSALSGTAQFDKAGPVLQEGLSAIQKVKDQYWEAVALRYLGEMEERQGRTDVAIRHYRAALALARSGGATREAELTGQRLAKLQKMATALSFGVVEIGSKGVKAAVVTSSRDAQGRTVYETDFRKSINANVIQGVVDTGEFSMEAMDATVNAVKELVAGMKTAAPKLGQNVTIAGSSALAGAMNRADLAARIQAETGITPIFINSAQELSYALRGSVNDDIAHKTALLDIGSGNGRIGYLISQKGARPAGEVAIDLRAGSVTLTELANRARAPGEDYVTALNRVVERDLAPRLSNELQQYPVLRRHQYFVVVGGAAWAMSSLLHPDKQGPYVQLSKEDFARYFAGIANNPDALLNPKLDWISDQKAREAAQKQINAVKNVFSVENLLAGARLLKMIGDLDPFGQAGIYFARDGNWAYGLAEAQALAKSGN